MVLEFWSILLISIKTIIYASSFTAMGGAVFLLIFDAKKNNTATYSKKMINVAGFVAIFSSLLFLPIQIGFIMDDGISGMMDFELMQIFLDGNIGYSLYLRVFGLIALLLGTNFFANSKLLLLIPIVAIATSFSLVGHATGEYQIITSGLIIVHLIAVSFWVGALLPLYLSAERPYAGEVLERFGKIASLIVPLLIAAGVVFAIVIIGSFSALFNSTYGYTFIFKIVIVGFLLGLATLNKILFVPQIILGNPKAVIGLKRTIIIESIAFVVIFIATATLTTSVNLPE